MASWSLDKARYVEEVFLPVAQGWDASGDLFRTYQLPLDVGDDAVVRLAVDGVGRHVNQNLLGGVHSGAAKLLSTLHGREKETLLDPRRRAAHRQAVQEARKVLLDAAREESAGAKVVPPAAVAAVTSRYKGRFVSREVEQAFRDVGVQVREPVELDVPAPPSTWGEIRLALRTIGQRSLGAYLRSPERGLGAIPTADQLKERARTIQASLHGEELTAEEKVLTALRRWVNSAELKGFLRLDTVEELSTMSAAELEDALRPAAVRRYLADLDLPRAEELSYALVCRTRYAALSSTGWSAGVDAALASRDLRGAHDLLAARTGLPTEQATRLLSLTMQLTRIDAELARARALEGTDPESAAEVYSTVLRECRDPEAMSGLRRCRPAAPPRVTAHIDGHTVRIEWAAAPARVGEITYRVVRRAPGRAGDGRVLAESTSELSLVDTAPPSAVPVTYAVSTLRDGEPSAQAAVSAAVAVLAPVSGLELLPGDGVVEVGWVLPDGADGVRVHRGEEGSPTVSTSAHDGSGYRDVGVRTGVTYTYRVEARYRLDSGEAHAEAVTGRVRPQQPPRPVHDLRCEPTEDELLIRWTPPPEGDVRVVLLTAPPAEAAGRLLPLSRAERLGTPIRGRTALGPGMLRAPLPPGGRRVWLLPLTVVGDIAVVGSATEYNSGLPAVAGLRVVPRGTKARLTWTWPAQASEARVYRRPDAPASGPADPQAVSERITHAAYQQEGCALPAPPGEQWYSVAIITVVGGEELSGPLRHAVLSAPREIGYEICRVPGWRNRGLRRLVVSAPDGRLPSVEVRGQVGLPPLDPADGEQLVRVDAPAGTDTTLTADFPVTVRGRPLHLRAFPVDNPGAVLVPTLPAQLRID